MPAHEWGFLIAINLFFGGLSAGLFLLSAAATLYGPGHEIRFPVTAKYGALLAPWPVMAGTLLLTADLGHWYRFYKLLLHFRWQSPMSIGTWLLTIFTNVALLYCWTWLAPTRRAALLRYLPKRAEFVRGWLTRAAGWQRQAALAGIPLSLGVATYTGVLLGVMPARPFWNTSLIAQLFLVSAVSAACAVLIVITLRSPHAARTEVNALLALDCLLLGLELVIVAAFVIFAQVSTTAVREAATVIFHGPYGALFWILFVGAGVATPFVVAVREFAPVRGFEEAGNAGVHSARVTFTAACLVLGGAFVLRCVTVFAGQAGYAGR